MRNLGSKGSAGVTERLDFEKMVLKATVQEQSSKQSLSKVSSEAAICRCSSK